MKKRILCFLVTMFVLLVSVCAYAGSDDFINITGSFNFEESSVMVEEKEKTISGTGATGTVVEIKVKQENSFGITKVIETYEFEIGVSGIFSKAIEIPNGESLIEFKAILDEKTDVTKAVNVTKGSAVISKTIEEETKPIGPVKVEEVFKPSEVKENSYVTYRIYKNEK